MFVDVGRVEDGDPEYLTWAELETVQDSGRWQLQLHSGEGHKQIQYGPGDDDYGPFYAYEEQGEDFDGWRERVESDIEWGQETLSPITSARTGRSPSLPPTAATARTAPTTRGSRTTLLGWLTQRYDVVFTQDVNARAHPGAGQPLGRLQVTRAITGGELYERLLSG